MKSATCDLTSDYDQFSLVNLSKTKSIRFGLSTALKKIAFRLVKLVFVVAFQYDTKLKYALLYTFISECSFHLKVNQLMQRRSRGRVGMLWMQL